MDADFEQHYQAAERAYGLGEYTEAHSLASALWDQLQSTSDEHNPTLVLSWRAVVALLLGHIQLHGLQQPDQAALFYQQVLDSEPEATLAALAEQGLEHCRSQNTVSTATTTPANGDGDGGSAIPDLLKDPFLTTDPDQAKPAPVDVVTAMPWLPSDEAPKPTSAAAQNPEPNPEPMANLEPEIITAPTEQPPSNEVAPTPGELTATLEPDITTELREQSASDVVEDKIDVEPTPQEPAAKDLLKKSWLRVQLQPEIKSPTDSKEPTGLINRIKGAFARSAGR